MWFTCLNCLEKWKWNDLLFSTEKKGIQVQNGMRMCLDNARNFIFVSLKLICEIRKKNTSGLYINKLSA